MDITKRYMTRNDCFKAGKALVPIGIMVHSTATPGVNAESFATAWNKSYKAGETTVQSCVHAFVDNKNIIQTLPFNMRGWHAGGKANDTHIGFEICEPAGHSYSGANMVGYDSKAQQGYFDAVWKNAVWLCARLCRTYGLDPLTPGAVICHSEGYKMGIATNHADVMHWFPKHGRDMDMFRKAVKEEMKLAEKDNTPSAWAEEAVTWAVENKLMRGDETGNLMLRATVTREELCVILHRLLLK